MEKKDDIQFHNEPLSGTGDRGTGFSEESIFNDATIRINEQKTKIKNYKNFRTNRNEE